jgi:hypothetical protein
MKPLFTKTFLCFLVVLVVPVVPAADESADLTYAIEINGVVCGYAEIDTSMKHIGGEQRMDIAQNMFMMLTVLGAKVNTVIEISYHVDPGTEQFTWMATHINQGDINIDSRITVEGDTAVCYSSLTGQTTRVALPEGTILENSLYSYHLIRDFVENDATEKSYQVLSPQEFAIQANTCTRVGSETVTLLGNEYETVIVDVNNDVTGMTIRQWLDRESGIAVKIRILEDRLVYLAEPSIKKQIELANLDSDIATKTNVSISDVPGIRYMKVQAKIKPTGLQLDAADLNVPGQIFEGTVVDNLIEGVFEVEHPVYDGTGAPPYPPDFSGDPSLEKYLQPALFIQSDDPVLLAKAREVADGSEDSWEAACRLSRWVAGNIGYAIPGGGTARKVYDLRAGECGGHSFLLASFCRSVGIPSRVVWGCMYIPNFGGSFGQHAWNEIYMGEAGWIPVDATAMEIDFVDSGHIRVGEYQSMSTALNAKEMEILDHRTGSGGSVEEAVAAFEKYEPYIGGYEHPGGGGIFDVRVENGSLAVEIPDKMVLGFNDPDENGHWRCMMSNAIYCTFTRDKRGDVEEMVFHEIVRMPRRSEPESIDSSVPDEMRPYLGGYYFAAVQMEFKILWDKKRLALFNPLSNETMPLKDGAREGTWTDRNEALTIGFTTAGDGSVTTLELDQATRFRRK